MFYFTDTLCLDLNTHTTSKYLFLLLKPTATERFYWAVKQSNAECNVHSRATELNGEISRVHSSREQTFR